MKMEVYCESSEEENKNGEKLKSDTCHRREFEMAVLETYMPQAKKMQKTKTNKCNSHFKSVINVLENIHVSVTGAKKTQKTKTNKCTMTMAFLDGNESA